MRCMNDTLTSSPLSFKRFNAMYLKVLSILNCQMKTLFYTPKQLPIAIVVVRGGGGGALGHSYTHLGPHGSFYCLE